MLTGKSFQLQRATLALRETDGKRNTITIPVGAVVKVVSDPSDGDPMVHVMRDDHEEEMFTVDLKARGTEIIAKSDAA